jgi:hypothetical protein
MKTRLTNLVVGLLLSVFAARLIHAADTVPVTVDNYIRAESDLYFGGILKDSGGAMGSTTVVNLLEIPDPQPVK